MKKDQIKVGGTYMAKVTDKVVPVRIDAENPRGGWNATNLTTNKKVHIKSAQALRGPAPQRDAGPEENQAIAAADHPRNDARVRDERETSGDGMTATSGGERAMAKSAKRKAKSERGPSGLDAAAQVLAEAGQPMRCGDLVKAMLERGLWKTGGKTPASTIYSAILREIGTKGSESRFQKTDRGLFAATPSA